jgi:hypothetical protein
MADAGADASAKAPNTMPIKAVLSLRMELLSVVILPFGAIAPRSFRHVNATALHLALQ